MLFAWRNLCEAIFLTLGSFSFSTLKVIFRFFTDLLAENSRLQEVFRAVPVDTDTLSPWMGNRFSWCSKLSIAQMASLIEVILESWLNSLALSLVFRHLSWKISTTERSDYYTLISLVFLQYSSLLGFM